MLQRLYCIFGALALALALGSCGGSSSSIDTPDGQAGLTPAQWAAMSHGTPAPQAEGALPAVPLDGAGARSTSGDAGNGGDPSGGGGLPGDGGTGSFTVLGADFLDMANCSVEGSGLKLNVGENAIVPGGGNIGWGLYKIGGLSGFNALSLNVECLPEDLGQEYFVGVADYSRLSWKWSEAVTIPEFQFDLSQDNSRYISNLGNLYFLVVCYGDNSALHSQSTVVVGDGGGTLPGGPFYLSASKGDFPDGIAVKWEGGDGADFFELQRSDDRGPNADGSIGGGEWVTIVETDQYFYFDPDVSENMLYYYRVRSINAAGNSVWSNVDYGYTGYGQPPPPGGEYALQGSVYAYSDDGSDPNGGGIYPLAGVVLTVVGADNNTAVTVETDQNGFYFVEKLSPGTYTVTPFYEGLSFEPEIGYFQISANCPSVWIDFYSRTGGGGGGGGTEMGVWGFVYASDGSDPNGQASPLPGAKLSVSGPDGVIVAEAITDDQGFYQFLEIPPGVWVIQASADGYYFNESYTFQIAPGMVPDLRFDFFGQPAP